MRIVEMVLKFYLALLMFIIKLMVQVIGAVISAIFSGIAALISNHRRPVYSRPRVRHARKTRYR
jgi:uncharacterized membrane protein